MYADVGHFGARPIQASWFAVVFPALLLNYLGQGAYVLSGAPVEAGKLFYSMVPQSMLYPMVLLATAATVIASQALISGAFSLVSQAIRLGLFPRLALLHTHEKHAGQIYVPFINWALFVGCVLLVLTFRSAAALAAAYGLAVSGVMLITSIAMFPISRYLLEMGPASDRPGLGRAHGGQRLVPVRQFAEIHRRRLCAALGRRRGLSGDDDLALGPQGDLRRLFGEADHDHGRTGRAASRLQSLHGAQCAGDVAEADESAERSRAGADPDAVGTARHPAAQFDPGRSQTPQSALHPRQPLSRHRVRSRSQPRQHYRRRVELRLHGRAQCRARAGGNGAAPRNRPAGRPPSLDRACVAGKPVAGRGA